MKKKGFEYDITDLGGGTFLINEYYSTMFVLCGSERALVIDCGTGVGDFKRVVESITPLPYDVVITHSHVDHVGGRGQFSDIYVSEADSRYIKEAGLFFRKLFIFVNRFSGIRFTGLSVKRVVNEPAVHFVCEGDSFDLGGRTVKIVLTPGHTVGSLCCLDVEKRTIFIGDIANEFLLMMLPHSTTIDEMIETCERLLSFDSYDKLWSSHHTSPHTREDIEKFLGGAKQVAARKRNTLLPIVKANNYHGAKLFYRTSYIHRRK